jgi:TolA-binding protein
MVQHNHRGKSLPVRERTVEVLLCVLAGLFLQTGCSSMPRMPSMPTMKSGSVDSLSEQVSHLKHSVDLMEKMVEEKQRERERSLNQLRTLVQESTGALLERQRRLQSGLGTLPEESGPPKGQQPPTPPPSSDQSNRFSAMHRSAYSSYQRGDFQTAYERYMQIYREAPSPAQKGQALFWAGECAYGMKDWDLALRTFSAFQKEFPMDPLVPSALLKMAIAYYQKGDSRNARQTLETLIGRFPNSEEADLARRRLADMSSS